MSILKTQILEYDQNGATFISLILPMSVLDIISKVLVYGVDEDGYQRLPNKIHYNKIKRYINDKSDSFMLPTSIILGADKDKVLPLISYENDVKYITIDTSIQLFRVVDGQHRISGLREAANINPDILNFPLNVIIVLSADGEKSRELQIFSDINSKGKRINTDLSELAKHDYQIKENYLPDQEINRHVAIKTAFYLKDKKDSKDSNVWQNAIKFDIHSEVSLGIIGVTIFSESIRAITEKYIATYPYTNQLGERLVGKELIEYTNRASDNLGAFLYNVWNDVIKTKWPSAFKEDIVKNDEGDVVKIYYDKNFYIQKGLGIKSINPIIGDITKESGVNDESFEKIGNLIMDSKVKIDDWKNGGPFAGFNSESGFSKIKQMILNKMSVPSVNPV